VTGVGDWATRARTVRPGPLALGERLGYALLMRVLVTGASGFVGRHLLASLPSTVAVHTLSRTGRPGRSHHRADVSDPVEVRSVLSAVRPDVVVHLAAIAQVRAHTAAHVQAVNVDGARHVAEALWRVRPEARLVAVSTGYVHGETVEPAAEDAPLAPVGPYATSKARMEGVLGRVSRGRSLCIVRPFNHVGPGQPEDYAVPAFVRKVRAVVSGGADRLVVGDLTAERDLADVRDLAAGLASLVTMPEVPPVLQICSGRAVPMRVVLHHIVQLAGLDPRRVTIESRGHSALRRNVGLPTRAHQLGIRSRPLAHTLADVWASAQEA